MNIIIFLNMREKTVDNFTLDYNNLWKMLIDKNMNRQALKEISGISTASIAKLGKGDNITTAVLLKICNALDCDLPDIMELVEEDTSQSGN